MSIKKLNPILFLLVLLLGSCKKSDFPDDLPNCMIEHIGQIENEPVRNPPAKIYEYQYNGQRVFFIPSYCCDQMSELLDANCKTICRPDGGITGTGDNMCTDFVTERTDEKLIWEDDR